MKYHILPYRKINGFSNGCNGDFYANFHIYQKLLGLEFGVEFVNRTLVPKGFFYDLQGVKMYDKYLKKLILFKLREQSEIL